MIQTISAPFVDTRAGDLALSLLEPPLAAEAVRSLEVAGAQVELRLLKASHQVAVRRDGNELIETLACLPSSPEPLPERHQQQSALGDYRTVLQVQQLGESELTRQVEQLLEQHAADDRYLVGQFPGHPLATTGVGLIEAAAGEVAWCSWHAYPQEQRLVLSRSTLRLRAADRLPAAVIG